MDLEVGQWMIADKVSCSSDAIDDTTKDVRPSPLELGARRMLERNNILSNAIL
jgi:hypothetical protein